MKNSTKIGWLFAATLVARFVAQIIILSLAKYLSNTMALVLNQLIILLPALFYIIQSKIGIRKSLRVNRIGFGNVVLVIVFAFLIMPIMNLISALSLLISENHIAASLDNTVKGGVFAALFAIALIPALVEETVFRGVIYNNLRSIQVKLAIIMSALLFGLLHLNFNQFCYAFAMGIVMCLLIEATDTIIAPMLVHLVINGYSTVVVYITPKLVDYLVENGGDKEVYNEVLNNEITNEMIINNLPFYIVSSVIGCLLAFIVYRTIAKNTDRWESVKAIWGKDIQRDGYLKQKGIFSLPLLVSIIACIVLIVMNR